MINILVTAVGSELAFSVIKAIRTMQTPYRLIGCDINKEVLGKCWCDTFYVVPKARNEDAYIRVIRKIIKEEIRPAVQMDGGDVKFLRFDNGIVEMQMHGSCWGCPNHEATLGAVYNKLASRIPEVKQVKII